MSDVQITGTIKSAVRATLFGKNCIIGFMHEDKRGRFVDGRLIHTSSILRVEGDIVFTKNSIYKVEWADEDAIKNMEARLSCSGATIKLP